jgi:hypothetical protein
MTGTSEKKLPRRNRIRRGKTTCRLPLRRGRELLQRAIDRSELGIERGAETIYRRDNRKRDARCDQTVFNRGCTRLIGQGAAAGAPAHSRSLGRRRTRRILPTKINRRESMFAKSVPSGSIGSLGFRFQSFPVPAAPNNASLSSSARIHMFANLQACESGGSFLKAM